MKSFIIAATLLGAASAAPANLKRDSTVTAYSQIVDGLNAAVSAPDYLTNHQLNGYDISSCRNYCTSDPGNCQSFNIFREFGTTSSSDPVYKCSLFSQRHTAADATNKGGQDQGYGQLTRIEWSQIQQRGSAYSVTNLKGAIDANAAGGYLGTSDIGYAYDPSACANACDKTSGCSYANLWQGWSQANGNDKPTCALFSSAAHPSGADTNYGQGSYYVTNSNLYTKTWN